MERFTDCIRESFHAINNKRCIYHSYHNLFYQRFQTCRFLCYATVYKLLITDLKLRLWLIHKYLGFKWSVMAGKINQFSRHLLLLVELTNTRHLYYHTVLIARSSWLSILITFSCYRIVSFHLGTKIVLYYALASEVKEIILETNMHLIKQVLFSNNVKILISVHIS